MISEREIRLHNRGAQSTVSAAVLLALTAFERRLRRAIDT